MFGTVSNGSTPLSLVKTGSKFHFVLSSWKPTTVAQTHPIETGACILFLLSIIFNVFNAVLVVISLLLICSIRSDLTNEDVNCLTLTDFGKSIDLTWFSKSTTFIGRSNTDKFECLQMEKNIPWKYQVLFKNRILLNY